MQEKRNIRLLISFGVLVTLIAVLFFARTGEESAVDANLFKVSDLTKVDKVVLSKNQKSIVLKFDGVRWNVNDQLADPRMVDVLFATLQQAQPKRPVAESLSDSINLVLENKGVLVSLFSSDELQKEIQVGGNEAKTQTFFKNKEEEQAFIMLIPGYRVYVGGIFELAETEWKDKYVFNLNWKNFKTLNASFSQDPKSDFEIGMGKDYYEVKGIQSDTTKLNSFLDAVSFLTVDQFVRNEMVSQYDSLIKTQPVIKMELRDLSEKTYSLALYEIGDKTVILGVIQGTQLAIFSRSKIAGIVRGKNWFRQE